MATHDITYAAWSYIDGDYISGDAANHTIKLMRDGVETTPQTQAVANAGSYYKATIDDSEASGCRDLVLVGTSTAPGVVIVPRDLGKLRLTTNQDAISTRVLKALPDELPGVANDSMSGLPNGLAVTTVYGGTFTASQNLYLLQAAKSQYLPTTHAGYPGGLPLLDASGNLQANATNMRGTDNAYTGTPPTTTAIATAVNTKLGSVHGTGQWDLTMSQEANIAAIPAVKAKTDLIGTASVTVRSASISHSDALTIVRGDSYTGAHNAELQWIDTGGSWPDLTNVDTITLTVRENRRLSRSEPAIVLATTGTATTVGADAAVEVALAAATTRLAAVGDNHEYDVEARWPDGTVVTLVGPGAPCEVLADQTLSA